MITTKESITTDFRRDTEVFFASLSWVYLSNRYGVEAQGRLLRFLTLSGLAPSWWGRSAMRLIARPTSHLTQALRELEEDVTEDKLVNVVLEIYRYARHVGASIGEPPRFPSYLLRYGYTQDEYLADLSHLYGEAFADFYLTPWPLAVSAPPVKAALPNAIFKHSVATMGITAGAIEQILALGGANAPNQ